MVPILLNLGFLLESRHMGSDRDCSQLTGNTEEIHLDENRPCRKLTLLTGLCREGIIAT